MSSSTTPLLAGKGGKNRQQQDDQKVQQVQSQIQDTQRVMQDNIHLAIKRGENFNELDDKSVMLEHESTRFREKSGQVRKNLCMQYYKQMAIFAGVVIAIVLIIVFIVWLNKRS